MGEGRHEFPASLRWLNTSRPVRLEALRGKVVLVLFWCCSNGHSLRMLATLRQIQQMRDPGVAVLGVHCPKFAYEQVPANVKRALDRNFVRFPTAQDSAFEAWRAFGVEAWPTVAVFDVDGGLRELARGDDTGERIDDLVDALLDEASSGDRLDTARPPVARPGGPSGFLRFPTAAVEARGMLYVSDTGNNRIVELTADGRVQRIFGSGNPGFWDGGAANCGFTLPRGIVYAENFLYVADSGNHAIRRIDLFKGEVEAIVGNGKAQLRMTGGTRRLLETSIPEPVGLAFQGPDLFVSASGIGQLWRLDLGQQTIGWLSGSGQHGVVDGEPVQAAFAQPLGLAAGRNYLYVADADGSAIRELRIQSGHLRTRIGQNPFVFGHDDGAPAEALLQFPMDVALRERAAELWVADSYNDCLRVLDLRSGTLTTPRLGYEFLEPAGLSIADDTLWVANTGAHEIVRVDLSTRECEAMAIRAER